MTRPIKQYAADIYFKDLGAIHVVMVWVYLIAGSGMLRANHADPSGDLKFLLEHLSPLISAMLLWSMSVWSGAKAANCCERLLVDVVMGAMGVWLWSLLFVSSALITPVESMSPLYLVCIVIEFWRTSRALHEYMKEAHDGA